MERRNPFKFGTIVGGEYFTDRTKELEDICHTLQGPNHLVLISPRRFGKSSLVKKAVDKSGRPAVFINIQQMTSVEELASALLKGVFKLYPIERLKHWMTHFRVIPTISTNPITDAIDLSFPLSVSESVLLEDAMELLDKIGSDKERLTVVFDEFQEIMELGKGIDRKLRAIMQEQSNINYIFLGSQESMMTEIFERKKSPFYHFGKLMYLEKIPYKDFLDYVSTRLAPVAGSLAAGVARSILDFTGCHPYYTQQLASQVWELFAYGQAEGDVVEDAISQAVTTRDYDYERLWSNFNLTDRKILQDICLNRTSEGKKQIPSSTYASAVKRLIKKGYVIRTESTEMEDPFFARWIQAQYKFY